MIGQNVKRQILLAPTTAAAQVEFASYRALSAGVFANGLSGVEAIPVEFLAADGTWVGMQSTTTVQLTPSVNFITLDTVGHFRLNKPVTTNPVGIVLNTAEG